MAQAVISPPGTVPSVFRNIYIHDEATNADPSVVFKNNHIRIRDGEVMLIERKVPVLVTERATGITKREYVVEYDIVSCLDPDWLHRSDHHRLCYPHKARLNGRGIISWSYLDTDPFRVRILACRADLMNHHTIDWFQLDGPSRLC